MNKTHLTQGTRVSLVIALVAALLPSSVFAAAKAAPAAAKPDTKASAAPGAAAAGDPHADVFRQTQYPSASQCAPCHKQIYDEWAISSHGYAAISPMFHKFDQRINDLASGTVGTFCVRCHMSVGTTLGEPRELPLWKRAPVSREGVTCITCHRVEEEFWKVNGERRIVPGDLNTPVYGPIGGEGVSRVIKEKDKFHVTTDGKGSGMKIHTAGIKFAQLDDSTFCVSCHQVAVFPGIKLEVVWDQYRSSPASQQGVTCQQCHMSKDPGKNTGYTEGPAAVLAGKEVGKRTHHNHTFAGPGNSIAHPGIFPHNPENENYPIEAWLKFDWRAGWGTEDFEEALSNKKIAAIEFPKEWVERSDREEARRIVEDNLKRLQEKRKIRAQVMENGSTVEGPFFDKPAQAGKGLKFHYKITNTNPGHNMPSGSLGAQPELWFNVAVIDPDGKNVFESGHVDSHGDMHNQESLDISARKARPDGQLFNLQTMFLTTNVKGTDREMYLPVQLDFDQLPFIRPAPQPTSVMNHPPFIRMESRSISPLGSRNASYEVPASAIKKPGKYKLAVRLRTRAEPIYFMEFCYATTEMIQFMNQEMIDIHPYTVEFDVR